MSKFIVIDSFRDMEDEGIQYPIGALYPREGYEPSDERIALLASDKNNKGVSLIKPLIELPAKTTTQESEPPKENGTTLSRDEIKAKLDELGVTYAKNLSTEKLVELLAAQDIEEE